MNFLYRNLMYGDRASSHRVSRSHVIVSLCVESVTGIEFCLAQPLSSPSCPSKDASVSDMGDGAN